MQWLLVALLFVAAEALVCPGGECPSGSTCCPGRSGQQQCCPTPNAVCCADFEHCCPQGYSCNSTLQMCTSNRGRLNMTRVNVTYVVCPGGQAQCPDYNTCCYQGGGRYGCCPYPQAVCCSGGLHCCPAGTVCDPVYYRCHTLSVKVSSPHAEPHK